MIGTNIRVARICLDTFPVAVLISAMSLDRLEASAAEDGDGMRRAHHRAGPSWQAADGSMQPR